MLGNAVPSPDEIKEILAGCGLKVPADLAEKVRSYLELLTRWSRQINLTGCQSPVEQVRLHFKEAFFAAARIAAGNSPLLDVGSGAGFPGLPIKLYRPELEVWLMEPRLKRAGFLWTVKRELGLTGVEVLNQTLEAWLAEKGRRRARLWTLRAVGGSERLLERAGTQGPDQLLLFWTRRRANPKAAGWRWREPEPLPWSREKVLLWGERTLPAEGST